MSANDCRRLSLSRRTEAGRLVLSIVHDGILVPEVAWHLRVGTTIVLRRLSHDSQGGRGSSRTGVRNRVAPTPRQSNFRAREQPPGMDLRWAGRRFPALRACVRRIGAQLFFAGGAAVRCDPHPGTTPAVCANAPVGHAARQWFSGDRGIALSARGIVRFLGTYRRGFCGFLDRFRGCRY